MGPGSQCFPRVLLQKEVNKALDVLRPLAQWRKYQLYSIDAVEQVHAKSRFLGHYLQIDRRRGDEAVRCGAAIQTKIVLVQHEQQLALRHQVQFVDAIQKKSAAVL